MKEENYKKGAFLIARKLFDSEIWLTKSSSWKVIWIYILGKVNHESKAGFERGEGYFNFSHERYLIGNDITIDMIKKFLQHGRRTQMIDTTRSTRGMRIKVLNYDTYQTIQSYRSTTSSTREAREKHERSTPINNNVIMEELNKNNAIPPNGGIIDDILNETHPTLKDYQYLGLEIYEKTGAPANKKGECIRLAREYPHLINKSLSFCLDYPNRGLKWKMFVWKLNELRKNV